jgi:hypothetical protein
VLATKPEQIEASGGIEAFLKKHPLEGLRIVPEEKRHRMEGDTVLGMDLQSYLTTQSIFETQSGRKSQALEMLMQAAGIEAAEALGDSPAEILEIAGKATHAALSNPQKDPNEVVQSLARLIEDLSPEYLINALPPEKQERLRGRSPQEIAIELAEDIAVDWAGKHLLASRTAEADPGGQGTAGEGGGLIGVGGSGSSVGGEARTPASPSEKEVARVLSRTLKTTQMAHRLLQKVGDLANQSQLPPELIQRIQEDLRWSALTNDERQSRLLATDRFDERTFRRLLEHVQDLGKDGNVETATQVCERFLSWLDVSSGEDRVAGLTWLPELLHALTGLHTLSFVRTVVERLCLALVKTLSPIGRATGL